ncbi:MAG: saccharopine dehydrogenase family protein [Planctomycetota bacterium]
MAAPGFRYLVLGAGRQGVAIAYARARFGEAAEVTVVDADGAAARRAAARVRRLAPGVAVRAVARRLGSSVRAAASLLRGHGVVVGAATYRLNVVLARAAVAAGASFCDLGGNTAVVREQLRLDRDARRRGVTIVPDCGLAPGLANVLAAHAVAELPRARHVQIRCGGLPLRPRGPLGYALLFSIEGLTNEYTGDSVVLRRGRIERVEAFTEPEEFRGPRELGALEAFHTSGGSSTAPWTFRGAGLRFQLLHRFDPRTRFTAMEQTTGYPTAAVAHALARKEIRPGAVPPERAGLGAAHLKELRRRGLAIRRRRLKG